MPPIPVGIPILLGLHNRPRFGMMILGESLGARWQGANEIIFQRFRCEERSSTVAILKFQSLCIIAVWLCEN